MSLTNGNSNFVSFGIGNIVPDCVPLLLDWICADVTEQNAEHFLRILSSLKTDEAMRMRKVGFCPSWIGSGLACQLYGCIDGFHGDMSKSIQMALNAFALKKSILADIRKTIQMYQNPNVRDDKAEQVD